MPYNPPNIDDGLSHYAFLPQGVTLYGFSDDRQSYWLRVVDHGNKSKTVKRGSKNDPHDDYVQTVDVANLLTRASYGYTPFLEVVYSGLRSGIDLNQLSDKFITQSAIRNYEQRAKILLGLCHKKERSILTRSNLTSQELMAELYAVLNLWEHLMNTGSIEAYHCLNRIDRTLFKKGITKLKDAEEKYDVLAARVRYANFVNLPVKMNPNDRIAIMSMYGIEV